MKTKYIALIAAAAAMLSFAGCGDTTDDKTPADSVTKVEAGADEIKPVEQAKEAAAETPAPTAEDSAAADAAPTISDTDTSSAAESAADSSSVAELTNVGDKVFNTPNGDYTFDELHADGLANTAGGKYYALVPSDGAAGHMYYKCFYTTNGTEWVESAIYDEANGNNYHYALPDGRILLFNTEGPIASNVPIVSVLSLGDDNTVKSTPVADFFKNQYLDDGSTLEATEGLTFYITYNGGFNFTISFTDVNGVIVYNVNSDLDQNTLLMT